MLTNSSQTSHMSFEAVAMTTDKQIRTHGTMRQLKTSERREVRLDRKSEQRTGGHRSLSVWATLWTTAVLSSFTAGHVTRPNSDVWDLQYRGVVRRRQDRK